MFIFFVSFFLLNEESIRICQNSVLAIPQTAAVLALSGLIQVLSALSSVAVILGVVFIVVQLRQNAKMIDLNTKLTEATFRDVKSNISFEILERLTDESFAQAYKLHVAYCKEVPSC